MAMIIGVEFVYFIAFSISIIAVNLAFLVYPAVPSEQSNDVKQQGNLQKQSNEN